VEEWEGRRSGVLIVHDGFRAGWLWSNALFEAGRRLGLGCEWPDALTEGAGRAHERLGGGRGPGLLLPGSGAGLVGLGGGDKVAVGVGPGDGGGHHDGGRVLGGSLEIQNGGEHCQELRLTSASGSLSVGDVGLSRLVLVFKHRIDERLLWILVFLVCATLSGFSSALTRV
jgi:hypothetical protein